MMHPLHTVRSYAELLAPGAEAGPYDFRALFAELPGDGESVGAARLARLRALDPFIRPMLADGERVLFVTAAEHTSPLVSALLGAVTAYVNRVGLAATDRRLLLIGVDEWDRPSRTRCQLRRRAVASVTGLPLGRVRIGLHHGGAVWLAAVPRADRGPLVACLRRFVPRRPGRDEERIGLETLCGTCGRVLGGEGDGCSACRGAEKREGHAALLALFVPGAGLLHLGRRLPALAQFLKALIILCAFIIAVRASGLWPAPLILAVWYATMGVGEWLLVRSHAGTAHK
jgi:hypothetical protein